MTRKQHKMIPQQSKPAHQLKCCGGCDSFVDESGDGFGCCRRQDKLRVTCIRPACPTWEKKV